jgi:hypothetical protein
VPESVYTGIARLMEQGASLAEVESYIEVRNRWSGEEERSAAWLRDWLAFERLEKLVSPGGGPPGSDPAARAARSPHLAR